MPIIEQVAEYVGRKLGDDIGALCYQYATMYNDAFIVVDCTGGQGDAAILTLINLGYKNLYYEDMSQKTYTVQRSTKNYDGYTDKLPGFHFQGNRYPVLSNFAGLVRNNEFKSRSNRVFQNLRRGYSREKTEEWTTNLEAMTIQLLHWQWGCLLCSTPLIEYRKRLIRIRLYFLHT
jgi:hypothetical protein